MNKKTVKLDKEQPNLKNNLNEDNLEKVANRLKEKENQITQKLNNQQANNPIRTINMDKTNELFIKYFSPNECKHRPPSTPANVLNGFNDIESQKLKNANQDSKFVNGS